ncbi:MAG: hypothetical protein H0V66_08715 [Bdellovibrionales bacterium]|nr:hypothetical protein [Bdellovibrionales bacterium]
MTRFSLLFAFLFCLNVNPSWATYTLPDLEVLTQEGNYDEFFAHALDIRPSERQDAWKGMLSKMADGYGRQILTRSEITKAHFTKIESLYTWPALKADDVFKIHRQEIGLRFLKACLKQTEPCWKELKAFWETDKNDPEVAFKLAEMTEHLAEKPITTWTFLDVALKSPLSEFYCKKDFVLDSLWAKLEIDYIRLGPKGSFLRKIDEAVHPDCLITFNKWILRKLAKPDKTSDRELAYQLLDAQGKSNNGLTDFFYTVYLLENPSKGELFNYAWNRLTELSKSMERREQVLKKIKILDPLPDELFSSLDISKKNAVLTHFKQKFPEYLYFYTEQCLLFYGGKNAFPHGNPTMKCQNLMETEGAAGLIGKDKLDRFHQVRSI